MSTFPDSVQRVAAYLQSAQHPHAPLMLSDAARTAQQAADALGVQLGQIAKSIIFRRIDAQHGDQAVLVITSGDKRVDEQKVQALVCSASQQLGRADAAFVKAQTGYAIGGVPPVAHAQPSITLIDQELARFERIWAAAGHPHAVFELSFAQLQALCAAPVANVVLET